MGIIIALVIWLIALTAIVIKFRRDEHTSQQRLFSIFLIVWSVLGIVYYDVLMLTTGQFSDASTPLYNYAPVVLFSLFAGIGTYFLMMTFRKFHKESPEDTAKQKKKSGKKSSKK